MPAPLAGDRLPARPATRLLVSVRDAREAAEAASAGAHIIDAKDPARGALGAVGSEALAAILDACPAGLETSAALGDLADLEAGAPDGGTHGAAPGPYSSAKGLGALTYVKVGLGGAPDPGDAERRMAWIVGQLGARVTPGRGAGASRAADSRRAGDLEERPQHPGHKPRLIVACYADHRRAASPPPGEVPGLARRAGADGCLLDTAVKDGSCLFDWIGEAELADFISACRNERLLCALAGSLRAEHLPRLAALRPDLIGVRSAACDGDRVRGRVRAFRVAALSRSLCA